MNQVTSNTILYTPYITNFYAGFCKKGEKKPQKQKILLPFHLPTYHSPLQTLKNTRIAFVLYLQVSIIFLRK